MRKLSVLAIAVLSMTLVACGNQAKQETAEPAPAVETTPATATEQVAKEAEAAAQEVVGESTGADPVISEPAADGQAEANGQAEQTAEARAGEDQQY